MPGTPLTRDQLARLTNLDELVDAPPSPEEQRVPTASAPPPVEAEPKRSTTDPFEANLGDVHVAEALSSRHRKSWVRAVAWVFVAAPTMVLGALGAFQYLGAIGSSRSVGEVLGCVGLAAAFLAMGGFWPYLLWRTRTPR